MNEKYFDESGDKKYFTIIPNYIANHSTANDQALYFQMKRLAGEGGICEAGYRYFIDKLSIGYKAFIKSKKYLLSRKWITYMGKKKIMTSGGEQLVDCYKVNDIWELNNEHYIGGVKRKHLTTKVVSKENKVVLKGDQGGAERKQKKNSKNNKNINENNWVKEILVWLEARRKRKFADYGKQISALGRLQKAGYEPEQIKKYMNVMDKDSFWRDKSPDFVNLAANIHKLR